MSDISMILDQTADVYHPETESSQMIFPDDPTSENVPIRIESLTDTDMMLVRGELARAWKAYGEIDGFDENDKIVVATKIYYVESVRELNQEEFPHIEAIIIEEKGKTSA